MKITGSQLIETLTSVNEQIVAGLARQHPPKCLTPLTEIPRSFIPGELRSKPWYRTPTFRPFRRSITCADLPVARFKNLSTRKAVSRVANCYWSTCSVREKLHAFRRVYPIIDEHSNSSLVSTELADELEADGPEEKYFLTTCSGTKETKYGRRVTDVVQSVSGAAADLPTLIECGNIPQEKREIPTPEMAKRFPHLQEIANEIPPLDGTANIHILIRRDAPELLKVREFRNGPKGTPWAQKLSLGWTIIGQMCLDLVGGPRRCSSAVPVSY